MTTSLLAESRRRIALLLSVCNLKLLESRITKVMTLLVLSTMSNACSSRREKATLPEDAISRVSTSLACTLGVSTGPKMDSTLESAYCTAGLKLV